MTERWEAERVSRTKVPKCHSEAMECMRVSETSQRMSCMRFPSKAWTSGKRKEEEEEGKEEEKKEEIKKKRGKGVNEEEEKGRRKKRRKRE